MSGPPYFPFFPDDFAGDGNVEAMTTLAVGAYILLVCKAWRENPPATIPDNDPVLARWARLSLDEWLGVRTEVLSAWTECDDGRWMQKRLRKEWDRFVERSRKAAQSADLRWKKKKRKAKAMRSHCESNARASLSESVSESLSSSVSSSGESEGKRRKARARNPRHDFWDALAAEFFPTGVPNKSKSAIGECVTQLIEQNADPAEISIRRRSLTEAWGDPRKVTMHALVRHWSVAAPPQRDDGLAECGPLDPDDPRLADLDAYAKSHGGGS